MIGILDYGVGNIDAFLKIYHSLNMAAIPVRSPSDFDSIDKIILPGVGSFDSAMEKLNNSGLRDTLDEYVLTNAELQEFSDNGGDGDLNTDGLGSSTQKVLSYSSITDKDIWTLLAISARENYLESEQGMADVAQSILNWLIQASPISVIRWCAESTSFLAFL